MVGRGGIFKVKDRKLLRTVKGRWAIIVEGVLYRMTTVWFNLHNQGVIYIIAGFIEYRQMCTFTSLSTIKLGTFYLKKERARARIFVILMNDECYIIFVFLCPLYRFFFLIYVSKQETLSKDVNEYLHGSYTYTL